MQWVADLVMVPKGISGWVGCGVFEFSERHCYTTFPDLRTISFAQVPFCGGITLHRGKLKSQEVTFLNAR